MPAHTVPDTPNRVHVPPEVLRLADLGWKVFPRCRHARAAVFAGASAAASGDPEQLRAWAAEYPGCGWSAVAGPSGVWALDVDVAGPDHAHDGAGLMRQLVAIHGPLPPRPMLRTGGGGWLVVFQHQGEDIAGESGAAGPGLDALRGRQHITLPPTLHHRTGVPYRWLTPPWEVPPPPAPAWLLRRLAPPPVPPRTYSPPVNDEQAQRLLYRACDRITLAREGTRNAALARACWPVAHAVADGRLDATGTEHVLLEAARRIGLDRSEALATIRCAMRNARRRG